MPPTKRSKKVQAALDKTTKEYIKKGTPRYIARNISLLAYYAAIEAQKMPRNPSAEELLCGVKNAIAGVLDEVGLFHEAESAQTCTTLLELTTVFVMQFDILYPKIWIENLRRLCAEPSSAKRHWFEE